MDTPRRLNMLPVGDLKIYKITDEIRENVLMDYIYDLHNRISDCRKSFHLFPCLSSFWRHGG